MVSERAPRNRTITITPAEEARYRAQLRALQGPCELPDLLDATLCQDVAAAVRWLPPESVDLLILDPPYNRDKSFNGRRFRRMGDEHYEDLLESWLAPLVRVLKPTASIYLCSDWRSSGSAEAVAARHFRIRNRITWEREKGRGAEHNWKNCSEDIWFCTVSDTYTFNVEAVKLRKRVLAPYRDDAGAPKDWESTKDGDFRDTCPSNLWTDLSVPFWSMPENTDHPTQKPEKLVAKLILASTKVGDVVLDPFLGVGTTSVVARKLRRRFIGIEIDAHYCCLALKRLELALTEATIQGYRDGVFWERNAGNRARRAT